MYKLFLVLFIATVLAGSISSCNNRSYPCPGVKETSAADLSMFGEDGELKSGKRGKRKAKQGRINKSNGMINKKSPKQIRRKKKTRF